LIHKDDAKFGKVRLSLLCLVSIMMYIME